MEWRVRGGERGKREGKPQKEQPQRGKERGGNVGVVRETFSLFVTLELGAEVKKSPLCEAIKSKGGGGKSKRREGDRAEQDRSQGVAASLAAFCCRVPTGNYAWGRL